MSTDTDKTATDDAAKKWRKRALMFGVVLAIVCHSLPTDYQAPCHALAQICTGGVLP